MKGAYLIILIAVVLILGALIFLPAQNGRSGAVDNVLIENGQQIINIEARGGYWPKTTTAAAGLPTVIKVSTNNTFDCSSALVIPSLNFRQNLPLAGVVEVPVPPQAVGAKIQGLCSMGMYRFDINFLNKN